MAETNKDRFAARLRELRTAAGLSRQELADRAGLKVGAIRDLEQAVNGPTWDSVLAIARVLGVSCEAFTQEPSPESLEPLKPGRPRKQAEGSETTDVGNDELESGSEKPTQKKGKR